MSIGEFVWTIANEIKIKYLKAGKLPARVTVISKIAAAGEVTIKYAVDSYLSKCERVGSPVGPDTLREYTNFLRFRLLPWCESNGVVLLKELEQLDPCQKFYETWKNIRTGEDLDTDTSGKLVTHFRSFFAFCITNRWITYNSAKELGKGTAAALSSDLSAVIHSNGDEDGGNQVGLSTAEYERVLDALDSLPSGDETNRLRAFIELLRWSGMRLADGIKFSAGELQKDDTGYICNFIQWKLRKHGEKARCISPIPVHVADMLLALPFMQGKFWFLPPGIKNPKSYWESRVNKVFALAQEEIPFAYRCTCHSLRHTFAIQKLNAHADIRHVSKWLGHFTLETTMLHYSHENEDTKRLRKEAARFTIGREIRAV